MGVYVNDNGTLRLVQRVFVNDNTVLREIVRWSLNDATTLRHVFAVQVSITNQSPTTVKLGPLDAFAGYQINSNGEVHRSANGSVQDIYATTAETWLVSGAVADYECMMHKNSGDAPNSAASSLLDTWLACSTSRQWGYWITAPTGVMDGDFTISIRRASDQVVLDTATVLIHCEVTA